MTIITWLLAGVVAGWLVCLFLGTTHLHAFIFNISVAIVGAAIGNWALGPTFGVAPGFGLYAVLFGIVCGVLFAGVAQTIQRRIMS